MDYYEHSPRSPQTGQLMRHRDKTCRLPCDSLTEDEQMALNGAVNIRNLHIPMSLAEFYSLPADLRRHYFEWMQKTVFREPVK